MACSQYLRHKWLSVLRRSWMVIAFCVVYSAVLFKIAIQGGHNLDHDTFQTSGIKCVLDLGWFPIYWNLTVSFGVLYLFFAGSFVAMVALESPVLLGYWLKIWLILWFAEMLARLGYYFVFCEILPAGILAVVTIGIGVLQVLLSMYASAVRWRMQLELQTTRQQQKTVTSHHRWSTGSESGPLTEASRIRLREGLARALGFHTSLSADTPSAQHPKSFGARIQRQMDDRWTAKYVPVEKDTEVVYVRD